jgi:uncharacterized protein (TIGR02117 family)
VKLFRINSIGTALRAVFAWPLLAVGAYILIAIAGSLIPVNSGWKPSQNGYQIYLHDNGIHLSIIVPRNQDGSDIGAIFPTTDLPEDQPPAEFLMFGWGDRDFYLNTPTWGDLRPSHALNAFVGSGKSLLHVDHLSELPSGVTKIAVEHEAYQTILSEIVLTAKANTSAATPSAVNGYGRSDVFYPARGHNYSILYTCNNWVSRILAKAGVKTGQWTPLPFGVMWWH